MFLPYVLKNLGTLLVELTPDARELVIELIAKLELITDRSVNKVDDVLVAVLKGLLLIEG